jgi:hypothetical protein
MHVLALLFVSLKLLFPPCPYTNPTNHRFEFRLERTIKLIPIVRKTTAIARKVLLLLIPKARKVIAIAMNANPAFFECFILY